MVRARVVKLAESKECRAKIGGRSRLLKYKQTDHFVNDVHLSNAVCYSTASLSSLTHHKRFPKPIKMLVSLDTPQTSNSLHFRLRSTVWYVYSIVYLKPKLQRTSEHIPQMHIACICGDCDGSSISTRRKYKKAEGVKKNKISHSKKTDEY